MCEWVSIAFLVQLQVQHGLLDVINGDECPGSADAGTAVEDDFVCTVNVGSWSVSLFVNAFFMVFSHDSEDVFNDFVVLLFWCTVIGPGQILELCYYPGLDGLALGVHYSQLHLTLYQVWHKRLHRYQTHFFIIIEYDALLRLIFLNLSWPVLMAFYFGVLFRMREHHNQ